MILLTGASGFLGKVIKNELKSQNITTLGRSHDSDIRCDLSVEIPLLPIADIVVHAAGKAHSVPRTEDQKKAFYDVNVNGTEKLLAGLAKNSILPRAFVLISSVAVYGREMGLNITEETSLSAEDAYGKSKIIAEQIVTEWCDKNNVICTIFRLPLIAGPNPPGNLQTMINAIDKGFYFDIGGGKAKKSIVLAEDVARVITKAAVTGGVYNLTDRYHPSFLELSKYIADQLGKNKLLNMPFWIANIAAKFFDILWENGPLNSVKLMKITSDLTFDDSKAVQALDWQPARVLENFKVK